MLVSVKGVWLHHSEGVSALVVCEDSVNLREEDTLRVMLENFYKKKQPGFAHLAIRVEGKIIYFRSKPNCKRLPPSDGEMIALLKAINCYPREVLTKAHIKKKPRSMSPASSDESLATV